MWKNFGKILEASNVDGTNFDVYQKFTPTENCILLAVKTWIINYNSPTFTDIKFQLRGNNFQNLPGELIATSTARTKVQLFTEDYGIVESYWEFDYLKLRENVSYHLVPYSPSYSPSGGAHLAWRKDWPDPVYRTNNEPTKFSAPRQSYAVRFITAKL